MSRDLIHGETFRARALLLAARLEFRNWPEGEVLGRAPLAVRLAGGGVAILFRHGAAVLYGASQAGERALRERLLAGAAHPYRSPDTDEIEIRVDPRRPEGPQEGVLVLHGAELARLQLVAEALARSLLLAHYETRLAADFERIEPLALALERKGSIGGGTRTHLKRIGALLMMEHRMVSRAEVGEKPELLWEHPRLERLHALLEDEYEIRERLLALDRKLELAARTERTLVDLISTRHALRVEWYILALIAVEIVLMLYSMVKS